MAYTKTTWVDRVVAFANRFTKSAETTTSVTLVADPGTVTQAGTTLSATLMNKIEQGIADALPMDGSGAMTGQLVSDKASGNYKLMSSGYTDLFFERFNAVGASGIGFSKTGTFLLTVDENGVAKVLTNVIWHAGNDGSGSGLDADLVKGYVPVNKAGDTMTDMLAITKAGGDLFRARFNASNALLGLTTGTTSGDIALVKNLTYSSGNSLRVDQTGDFVGILSNEGLGGLSLSVGNAAAETIVALSTYEKLRIKADGTMYRIGASGSGNNIPETRDNAGVLEFFTSGAWKAAGGVKSVQTGIATAAAGSTNVAISAVVLAKSVVHLPSLIVASGSATKVKGLTAQLTSPTNLQIIDDDGAEAPRVAWEVVEYN